MDKHCANCAYCTDMGAGELYCWGAKYMPRVQAGDVCDAWKGKREDCRAKTIPLDAETEQMLISAVRYALGRRTYIVSVTVDYIAGILHDISTDALCILYEDLKRAFALYERSGGSVGLGDDCDAEDWKRLRAAVKAEIINRGDYYPELEAF